MGDHIENEHGRLGSEEMEERPTAFLPNNIFMLVATPRFPCLGFQNAVEAMHGLAVGSVCSRVLFACFHLFVFPKFRDAFILCMVVCF